MILPSLLEPCERWPGSHRRNDGRPLWNDGKQYAYRMLWLLAHGSVPPVLHHLCHNVWCVRLDHLAPKGSQSEHMRAHPELSGDKVQAAKIHCAHGHAYDEANTAHWGGQRTCRTCHAAKLRRYRAERKTTNG
jgi:hypothetical protein